MVVETNAMFNKFDKTFWQVFACFGHVWSEKASAHHIKYLIFIVKTVIWQFFSGHLVQNDSICIHVTSKVVWIWIVHSDYFWRHPQQRACWLVQLIATLPA